MKNDTVRRAIYEIEVLRQRLEKLESQSIVLSRAYEEHLRTKNTLEELKTLDSEKELLIPIGSETFIPGKIKIVDKVIIGIGANIAMEEKIDAALERVKKRITEIEKAQSDIHRKMEEIQTQIENISSQLNVKSED